MKKRTYDAVSTLSLEEKFSLSGSILQTDPRMSGWAQSASHVLTTKTAAPQRFAIMFIHNRLQRPIGSYHKPWMSRLCSGLFQHSDTLRSVVYGQSSSNQHQQSKKKTKKKYSTPPIPPYLKPPSSLSTSRQLRKKKFSQLCIHTTYIWVAHTEKWPSGLLAVGYQETPSFPW